MTAKYQRVYAQIDLDAIHNNMEQMHRNLPPGTKMIGVVKTDAYGHGAVQIGRELEPLDYVYGYATATAEEAFILRHAGLQKPILVLGYAFPDCYEELIRQDIRTTVFREDSIEQLADQARKVGKQAKVHVKVETGMNRLGIGPDESGLRFVEKVLHTEGVILEGMFTHFARADETDKTETRKQLTLLQDFMNRVEEKLDFHVLVKHCANSAAIVELPEAGMDVVRAGITLYGMWPSAEVSRDIISLQPVLALRSHIIYIKEVEAGQPVSYGGTYVTPERMRIATIPVGYGDGYPRSLSGKGWVLIRGKKAPVLGRVCMDQFMVSLADIPEAEEGDMVTLIGRDGREQITVEELGELSGRFNYELACGLGKRIPRVYVKGGKVTATKDYYDDYR